MRLFGRTSSSNTQKVLWALHELGLGGKFELVPTSRRLGPSSEHLVRFSGAEPYGEPAGYAEHAGPRRMIPVLVDPQAGVSVWESNTIVRFLAQKYGPTPLYDGSAEGMAEASSWMASAHVPRSETARAHPERTCAWRASVRKLSRALPLNHVSPPLPVSSTCHSFLFHLHRTSSFTAVTMHPASALRTTGSSMRSCAPRPRRATKLACKSTTATFCDWPTYLKLTCGNPGGHSWERAASPLRTSHSGAS